MQYASKIESDGSDNGVLWCVLRLLVEGKSQIDTSRLVAYLQANFSVDLPAAPLLASMTNSTNDASVVAEIESLLRIGDRESAVVRAVETEMWATALIIANFESAAVYRRIIRRYADATFSIKSLARFVFMLYGGQGAEAIHELDLGAMDWKTVLCAIVVNTTPETSDVLIALGDRLWIDFQNVLAAHVCYILAQIPVEASSTARMVLVGGDHKSDPLQRRCMTAASIQRTEVFMFVKMLTNPQYCPVSTQAYRLVYAMWLADVGYVGAARRWVKDIAACIKVQTQAAGSGGPSPFSKPFLRQFKIFEDRLGVFTGAEDSPANGKWSLLNFLGSKKNESPKNEQARVIRGSSNDAPTLMAPPQRRNKPASVPEEAPKKANSFFDEPSDENLDASIAKSKASPPPQEEKKKAAPTSKRRSWLGDKITKWLNPEAKIAKGIGGSMDAYYDEKLKRWVFPGEDATSEPAHHRLPP